MNGCLTTRGALLTHRNPAIWHNPNGGEVTPEISVVVPAYQNSRTLKDTIDSILAQDGVPFEVIVADHSSPDGTWTVMEQFSMTPG